MTAKKAPVGKEKEVVTLGALCSELKIEPYDARVKLRAAVKDAKAYPALAKSHAPRKSWEWPKGSPALDEARKALKETSE